MSVKTLFTNDFRGCHPRGRDADIKPISLVCKVSEVWRPGESPRAAVKLSDNPEKAMSVDADAISRYKRVFGVAGMTDKQVVV